MIPEQMLLPLCASFQPKSHPHPVDPPQLNEMHRPTPSCMLTCLTALSQHHRDKPRTVTLTPSVPILHGLCWVEDIINSGSKAHGHCCDLRASPLWQEVAVDGGQVEAMLDNAWRPAHEQPSLTKEGKRTMQCSALHSQFKLDVPLLMQMAKLFLFCEHTENSLSELFTPLTPKTMDFLCLQYLSMSFIVNLTTLTEQRPAAGTTLGRSGSSRQHSLLSTTLIFISVFTFSQTFSAQENETGLKEWGHWRCTKLPWDEWLGIRIFHHDSRLGPVCRAVCKGAKRFQPDLHRSWKRLLIPSLRSFSWDQTHLFAQEEQIASSHRHLKEKYSKETPALRLTGTS